MLHFLSEDPRLLLSVLGVACLGFLAALWLTQQGKYLIGVGITVTLALGVLAIEHFWVTDNERIEGVVYDLASAVEASDAARVIDHLAPEATLSASDTSPLVTRLNSLTSPLVREAIRHTLSITKFDYIHISNLSTSAGEQSRRGTAEFKVHAMLSITTSHGTINYMTPTGGLSWSLGFRETSPKVWKVTRITPMNPPPGFQWPFGIPGD
ncbi:MAG TPA: hypothetical protein VGZ22_27390 [Isosphaeraceae bacterium]|nr:hypothetical protein [Isosphaeraceae bacterium]